MRVRQESTKDIFAPFFRDVFFISPYPELGESAEQRGCILNRKEEIVRAKVTQNQDMKQQLLATGNLVLEEGNGWHDTFWGVDLKTGEGENHLGRILMQVREELREER